MFSFVEVLADLHLTINLKGGQIKLKGLSGIYCIKCSVTGAMYIGSSINLALRLIDHLVYGHTNQNLQNAIAKYGLENFEFCVLEFCDLELLLQRPEEQHYLDILFSLPAKLRYNFNPIAGSSLGYKHTEETLALMSEVKSGDNNHMYGKSHTPETRTQMSESQQLVDRSGENNPMFGKSPTNAFHSGPNHPMYGKVPANAMTINVYSLPENVLVQTFSSIGKLLVVNG